MPYCDTNERHLPTIGIGFNLTDSAVRDRVFEAMGINSPKQRMALTAVINDPAIRALPTASQRNAELRQRLNKTLGQSFSMTDSQIREVFALESQSRTHSVQTSSGLEYSFELAAVVSAQYTGVFGPALRNALQSGNRAEAWYELRYRSNADGDHGKRRYVESTVLGLYGREITPEDARNVYRSFTLHRAEILDYEDQYCSLIASANGELQAANIHEVKVVPIAEALEPAKLALLEALRSQYPSIADKLRDEGFLSTNIYSSRN